jgi:mRNA interferase MazF
MARYVPKKGDFVALSFDPQSGHEQKGRRPALVVSNDLFNKKMGLAIACPVTSRTKKLPFHVEVSEAQKLSGYVMVEQVKSIDYRARKARFIEKADPELMEQVLGILETCIY